MLQFTPLTKHNNWELAEGFYMHGKLSSLYKTDLVTSNVYYRPNSQFYKEGVAVGGLFQDIPEGIYTCYVDDYICTVFSWKVIHFCKGTYWNRKESGAYDCWLQPRGLICLINDKQALEEAEKHYKNKDYII